LGKNKLKKWSAIDGYSHVIQPAMEEVFNKDFHLKGRWREDFFKNNNPLVLELGCGKGEYSVSLARLYPEKNFIGIDIKGARIWRGATDASTDNLTNVAFIRTRIELISSFFGGEEVDEIWITFPDPQAKTRRAKKRLTGPLFLNMYSKFIKPSGVIHLKTDSTELYEYTAKVIQANSLEVLHSTRDLYSWSPDNEILGIRTYYEQIYLNQGKKITYTAFILNPESQIKDIYQQND
jgi:tRNA (guanine-N7-)-methyltransferase